MGFKDLIKKKDIKAIEKTKVIQKEYPHFIKEMDAALVDMMYKIPEDSCLVDTMGKEMAFWLQELPDIATPSFKAGVCFGIFSFVKARDESKKKIRYVV